MEAGMDSLLAVEFRNRLTKELPGVKLSNTVMFDYPTVDAIAGFALSQQVGERAGRHLPEDVHSPRLRLR